MRLSRLLAAAGLVAGALTLPALTARARRRPALRPRRTARPGLDNPARAAEKLPAP